MIQNVLSQIGGIGLYGVISILLFVLVFTAVLLRTLLLKKSHLDALSSLPLQEDKITAQSKENCRHE